MSSLNINYNGNSIPIADIGIVSSKEKVILGNLERDLVIQTLGSVNIQVGNKFYELSFSSENNNATISSNIEYINSISDISISSYEDGVFIFDKSNESLYIVYNGSLKLLAGKESSNKIFLSFMEDQIITGEQKQRLCFNSGSCIKTLDDIKLFSQSNVYENQVIFIQSEKQHYILNNVHFPNLISSWETFYVGSNGGVISNGLTINNKTRENLLYLNGIDNLNSSIFNGLKIGDNDSSLKLSVNSNNQSVISYNTKELLIKDSSNTILRTSDGRIGIGGNPSGSNSYKITIDGPTRFTSPVFTDSKISSTDYISTNVSHWDGGQGFGLTRGNDGKWSIELENALVRGSLIANKVVLKELEVERTYATGGHMLITDGAQINSYTYRKPTDYEWQYANIDGTFTISTTTDDGGTVSNTYTGLGGRYGTLDKDKFYYFIIFKDSTEKDDSNAYVALPTDINPIAKTTDSSTSIEEDTLDEDNNCPFIYGDVLLCQTASGLTAKKYYCLVSFSTNKYIAVNEVDFKNNNTYDIDSEGNNGEIIKSFSIASGDNLIRVTNLSVDNTGNYLYKERRRFIDIDGTRNQITMYDNIGKADSFSTSDNDINLITGIKQPIGNGNFEPGALKLRMGRLDDLGITGLGGYGLYADNVYLKGKLIIKNDDLEIPVGANRGTWANSVESPNLNTYYENDLVTYNGSVYRCLIKHTNTALSAFIPGIALAYWEIYIKKGEDGVAGTSFRYVDISGEQVFVYNQKTELYDKSYIPLTCTAFNVDYNNLNTIEFVWKINDTTIYNKTYTKEEALSGTISHSVNIYPLGIEGPNNWNSIWADNKKSISVKCLVYVNGAVTYDSDTFSVYKVENGKDGTPGVSPGVLRVYGEQIFKYKQGSSTPENSNIILTTSIENISNTISYQWSYYNIYTGLWTPLTESQSSLSSYTFNVGLMTYTEGTNVINHNSIRIRCLANGYTDEITLVKIYDGSDSINVILSNETHTIACDKDGNPKAGEINKAITQIRVYRGGNLLKLNDYTIVYQGLQDNDDYDADYVASGDDFYHQIWFFSVSGASTYVDIIVTIGATVIKKRFSVSKSIDGQEGSSGILGMLTNDSVSLISSSNGTVSDFSTAVGYFKMYYGTTDVTSSSTFAYTTTGCTGTINDLSNKGYYSVTSFDNGVNAAYLTLTGTYNGTIITKIFSVSKAIAGQAGISPSVYSISPSVNTIVKSPLNIYSPSSVTFQFYKTIGSSSPQLFSAGTAETFISSDGISFQSQNIVSGQSSIIGTPIYASNTKYIKCNLYLETGKTTLLDSQTILVVSDGNPGNNGNDAYTVILSNESFTIPSLSDGAFASNVFDTNYGTDIVVYKGVNKQNYSTQAISGEYKYLVNVTSDYFNFTIALITGSDNIDICNVKISGLKNGVVSTSIPKSVNIPITISLYNGLVLEQTFTKTMQVTKALAGPQLEWINEWDGKSIYIGDNKIISPKIFTGVLNDSDNTYTGISIGRDAFNNSENGVAGYYHNEKTFHLNAFDGSFKFGLDNSSIMFNPSTRKMTFGPDISLNWTNYTDQIYNNIKSKSPNIIPYSNAIHSILYKQYANLNYIEFQDDLNGTKNASYITSTVDDYGCLFRIGTTESYSNINLQAGKKYTFSIWVKNISGSGKVKLNIADNFSNVIQTSNLWQRISYTFLFSGSQPTWKFADIRLQSINDQILIWRPQIESGEILTPWIAYNGEEVQSGRNLLINSNFNKGFNYWTTDGTFEKDETGINNYIGYKPIKYTGSSNNTLYYSIYRNVSSALKPSTTYTLSCYAKYNNNTSTKVFGLYCDADGDPYKYNNYPIGNSDWKKYTLSFTTSTTVNPNQKIGWYFQSQEANTCIVWLTMFKLEEGFQSTDWTPAPEDTNSTYIDSNGIYTGTISANNITTGTLSADRIAAGSINSSKLLIDDSITVGGILHNGSILVKDQSDAQLVLLDRKGITATGGAIGGWTIEQNSLSTTGTNAELNVDLALNQFLHINDTTYDGQEAVSGNLISIRADNITGISIYTQSPSGVGINLKAQTGAYAIKSHGSHMFYQRSGEVWNAPGVLWAGTVKKASESSIEGSALNITNEWGNGLVITSTSYHHTGRYRFNHNLGRSDYMVFTQFHLDAYGGYWKCACKIGEKTDTYFDIQCFDTYNGNLIDGLIDVMVVGRNYYDLKK